MSIYFMHTSLSEAFFFHRWRMLLFRIQVPALKIFVYTNNICPVSCLTWRGRRGTWPC